MQMGFMRFNGILANGTMETDGANTSGCLHALAVWNWQAPDSVQRECVCSRRQTQTVNTADITTIWVVTRA